MPLPRRKTPRGVVAEVKNEKKEKNATERGAAPTLLPRSLIDSYNAHVTHPITQHQLHSFNTFVRHELHSIVAAIAPRFVMRKALGGGGFKAQVFVGGDENATGIYLDKPTLPATTASLRDASTVKAPMYPNEARLHGTNYESNLFADILLRFTMDDGREVTKLFPRHRIGALPIMLQSDACVLSGRDLLTLREMGECPFDQGGYFIIGGREKVIVAQEHGVYNRLFVTPGKIPGIAFQGTVQSMSTHNPFPKTLRFHVFENDRSQKRMRVAVEVPGVDGKFPLFVLFRVLGVESDRDIMALVLGADPLTVSAADTPSADSPLGILRNCAIEAAQAGVFDQMTAADVLLRRTNYKTEEKLKHVLAEDVLPNAGEASEAKATFLGNVVGKLLRAVTGADPLPDRDSYENKRVHVSGVKLSHLFRDKYRVFMKMALYQLDREFYYGSWRRSGGTDVTPDDLLNLVNASNLHAVFDPHHLQKGMVDAFRGSWNVDDTAPVGQKEAHMQKGVVQDLERLSYMLYVSHVRRINGELKSDGGGGGEQSMKLRPPHLLYPSHWGVICPVETPEGTNVGIVKHLAGLCHVTQDHVDPSPLVRHLTEETGLVRPADPLFPGSSVDALMGGFATASDVDTVDVLVNNNLVGKTWQPARTERYLLALRRNGLVHPQTSVKWEALRREIHLFTDAGRLTRPLLIAESVAPPEVPGQTRTPARLRLSSASSSLSWEEALLGSALTEEERNALLPRSTGFATSVLHPTASTFSRLAAKGPKDVDAATERLGATAGMAEFVDVEETNARLVAMTPHDLSVLPCQRYTHCELHPSTFMGTCATCIPFMPHNQAPRNVFSMQQSKRAVGLPLTTVQTRMDTMAAVLNYAQRPVVTTSTSERMWNGNHAFGENAVVAIACFTGYNQEDAVIMNRASLDRGLFNTTYFHTEQYEEEASAGGDVRVVFRNPLADPEIAAPPEEGEKTRRKYAHLDDRGMPVPGTYLAEGDVAVGRVKITEVTEQHEDSIGIKRVQRRTVHEDASLRVHRGHEGLVDRVFLSPYTRKAKIRMTQLRVPEPGDKFASRHGQKGVIGLVASPEDMPFSASTGTFPDMIINPHAIPSRMTVGHLLECLLGKAGAAAGERFVCDPFDPEDVPGTAAAILEGRYGMQRWGDEIFTNGRTGELQATPVFVGPTYYMRLKHMVTDKINHRSYGPKTALTRQPNQGRGKEGGLRVGEMEQNALISHGAAHFLKESFMERSDASRVLVDGDRGLHADGPAHSALSGTEPWAAPRVRPVSMPYAFKLFQQELRTAAIRTRLVLDPTQQEAPYDVAERVRMHEADEAEEMEREVREVHEVPETKETAEDGEGGQEEEENITEKVE